MKWISVEDALPEIGERVVFYSTWKNKWLEGERYSENKDGYTWRVAGRGWLHTGRSVSHWMRIEPPKVRKEGE